MKIIKNTQIIEDIRNLLISSRQQIQYTVNHTMVQTYWNIGKMIVEDEQGGNNKAQYGKKQLEYISNTLTKEFGKGFDSRNLRNMRQFYIVFPIWHSVSAKLSWTHYKKLMTIENQEARQWYIDETIANNWSARALDRQIANLYYERLLSSQDKSLVQKEAKEKTNELQIELLRERNLILDGADSE